MADKNKLEVVLSMIDEATKPLQNFAKRVEKLQDPVRKVSNKLAIFGEAAGFGKLRSAVGGVGEAFGNVAAEAGALATKVAAGVGVIGGALFGLVKMTADAGDAFDELSTKAGVSASFFQKAAYAASFASVSQESLAASLGKMNANIVAANTGSKEMQQWFRRAGISANDLKKEKPEEIFKRVLEYVNTLPKDSAKAGAMMRAIFGKSGGDLLPMVSSFKELADEAERLGLVLSDETIAAGAAFNDTFDKLVKVLKGVGMTIGGILMPYFQEAIEAITTWTLANRELIATKVAEWVEKLKENWPEIRQGALDAWDAIKKIADMASGFVEAVGGIGNTVKIVAAIMAGPLLLAIGGAAKAIWLLGAAIGGTPVGWFLAAVMAIALAAKTIYDNWEPIKQWFATLFDDPLKALGEFLKKLMSLAEYVPIIGPLFKGINAVMGAPTGQTKEAGVAAVAAGTVPAAQTVTNNASVQVDFKNVPRGVEVTPGANNRAPVDLSMGYAMTTP